MIDTPTLRQRMSRVALIWLLPLALSGAAGLAAYQLAPEPPSQFQSSITIRPPSAVQASAASVNLFVSDLEQVAKSDALTLYVLDQLPQLDPDAFPADLGVERQGATSWVTMTFVHADEEMARQVLELLTTRILDDTARLEVDRTEFAVQQATLELETAQANFEAFIRSRSVFDPEVEYRMLLDELSRLQTEIVIAQTDDADEAYVDSLIEERTRLEAERPLLGENLIAFQDLENEVGVARESLDQALEAYEEAEFTYLTVDDPSKLVGSREVAPFVDNSQRLQRAAFAAAVALGLSLLIVVPLAWRLDRQRVAGRHVDLDRESMLGTGRPSDEPLIRQLSR